MASYQFLSLPQASNGITVTSGSSAWAYGSWTELTGGTDTVLHLVRPMFSVNTTPTADTVLSFVFEIAIGASGSETVIAQIPYNYKIDTNVGIFQSPADGLQTLPEMPIIPVGSRVSIRIVSSHSSALTLNQVKLQYREPLTDPYVTVTKTAAYSVCVPIGNITDNFNDNSLAAVWTAYADTGMAAAETNEQIELTGATATGLYAGVETASVIYSLVGGSASVRLIDVGVNHANRTVDFLMTLNANNNVYWEYNNGALRAWKAVAGTYTQVGADITYSAATHVYLRFRESDGTVYYDWSTNGFTWTNHSSTTVSFSLLKLRAEMNIGNNGAVTVASGAVFDNFNLVTPTDIHYYFNGTASDANSVWNNDANAFDGSLTTYADGSTIGTTTTNYLGATGTTAPSAGGIINDVRFRIYGVSVNDGDNLTADIYDGANYLSNPSVDSLTPVWGALEMVNSPPTWTWAKIQGLSVRIYNEGTFSTPAQAYKVEAVVTVTSSENFDITKSADYAVYTGGTPTDYDITKSAQYAVSNVATDITKTAAYVVQLPKTATLTDDYDDNSRDTDKWDMFNHASETNNRLELSIVATESFYSGYTSHNFFDLTGSQSVIQLLNAGNQAITNMEVYILYLYVNGGTDGVFFYINQNNLHAYKKVSSVNTSLVSTTYSSTNHKWFRIREASGTTYWDTSANGIDWTNFYSVANPITVTALKQETSIGTWSASASSTTVIFDNFNLPFGVFDITKSAQYVTISQYDITKTAQYQVLHDVDITKSAQYCVITTPADITKTSQYMVAVTPADTTKSAQYYVSRTTDITKSAQYVPTFIVDITKSASYVVVSAVDITKTATYQVPYARDITKTAQYAVPYTPADVTKSASYQVARDIDITKSAQYTPKLALLETLTDDFNDNVTDTAKWVSNNAGNDTTTETNGQVEFAVNAYTSGSYGNFYKTNTVPTRSRYDLTGSYYKVEVISAGTGQVISLIEIIKQNDSANRIQINVSAGNLYFQSVVANSWATKLSIPYDRNLHRWWRIRELAGYTYCDTSANGRDWTNRVSWANEIPLTDIMVNFGIWHHGATGAGTYIVDNFNVDPDYYIVPVTAEYRVARSTDITKTASYVVVSAVDISKTAQYQVPSDITVQKSAQYSVPNTPADITKTADYDVARLTDITKTAQYAVPSTPTDIQKTAGYVVVSSADITKVAQYQVPFARDVTKSAQYTVPNTPADKTVTASYQVARPLDITKTSQYTVITTPADITKSASYVVISSQDITKTAQYQVPYARDITKSAQYAVPNTPADVTKSAEYRVATTPSDITKFASYLVARTIDVTKSAEYVVNTENFGEVQVSATYAVASTVDIQKTAQYTAISAIDITKTAQYCVQATTQANTALTINNSLEQDGVYWYTDIHPNDSTLTADRHSTNYSRSGTYSARSSSSYDGRWGWWFVHNSYVPFYPVIGQQYTISAYFYTPVGSLAVRPRIQLYYWNWNGYPNGSTLATISNGVWTRVSHTFTAVYDPSEPSGRLRILFENYDYSPNSAVEQPWYVDDILVEEGNTATDYVPFADYRLPARYFVTTTKDITKTASYSVARSTDITKFADYDVTFSTDIQKSASYVVISSADIAKTSQYTVLTTKDVTKAATYAVPRTLDVTKSAQYAVLITRLRNLQATYAVLTTTTITKQAQYTVVTGTDIGKPSGYSVARSTDITKPATYLVARDSTVQVSSEYAVRLVEQDYTVQIGSEYRVAVSQAITVASEYRVGIDKIVQKLATYRVLARYPTPELPSGITIYAQAVLDITSINVPMVLYVEVVNTAIDIISASPEFEIVVSSRDKQIRVR